jgi:putative hydrolase of the HAD superfamily
MQANIKNIIFDLGGVILNVDYPKTVNAFKQLGAKHVDKLYAHKHQDSLIDKFEVGAITPEEFRQEFQNKMEIAVSDEVFDQAWNAMLQDLPAERLNFIQQVKEKYRTFLFSNNNVIHLAEILRRCQQQYHFNSFDQFFERVYFSHILGLRKPHPQAFQAILEANHLKAGETLFIDDSLHHIQGAEQVGLQVIYLTADRNIFDLGL